MTSDQPDPRPDREPIGLPPLWGDGEADRSDQPSEDADGAATPASETSAVAPSTSTGSRRRRRRLIAGGLVLLGAFGAGIATSQLVLPRTVAAGPVTVLSEAPGDQPSTAAEMPDVMGLDLAIARRVLRSNGVTVTPKTTSQPAAGRADVVLRQTPAPGEPASGPVEFTLSAVTEVPDLEGMTLDEARDLIEGLGGSVTVQRRLEPSSEANTVLETSPAAGESLPENLVITVADPGEGLPLANLNSVDSSSCSTTTEALINGTPVHASIVCTPQAPDPDSSYEYEPAAIEWAVGRHAAVLEFTAGAEDTGGQGGGKIIIYGDGEKLDTINVRFGATDDVRVDISGVLRLRIEVSTTSEASPQIVLGDANLLGIRNELEKLAGDR